MKKTNLRKLAAFTASILAVAALAVPMTAFADTETPTTSITVTDSTTGASTNYEAYRLLNATVDSSANDGAGAYTYTLNSKYTEILQAVTGKTSEEDIEAFIAALTGDNAVVDGEVNGDGKPKNMREFADQVYNKIIEKGTEHDLTTSTGSFADVAQGYYLIAQKPSTSETDGATSLVMVNTAGDTELKVTVKKDLPSFDKQIGDINDSAGIADSTWDASDYTWGDDADHDKSALDAVPFRLIATLPDDYANYNHYTLRFHDDLQGNVFGTDVTIKAVYVGTQDSSTGAITKVADITDPNYIKQNGCGHTHTGTNGNGCDFMITIPDLKTACASATKDNVVVVEYTAPFTANTIVGSDGNWNNALLEYSNNPYNSGYGTPDSSDNNNGDNTPDNEGPTGENGDTNKDNDDYNTTSKTPIDTVVAFTYKTIITKKDGSGNALDGAEFTLQKVKSTATLTDGKVADADKIGGAIAVTVSGDENNIFTFEGLDDGRYVLTESKVPQGYNGIDPIVFDVTATHTGKALTGLNGEIVSGTITLAANATNDTLSADVVNQSGNQLPSTGGMGTTLFYVGGGALALGAGVLLVSKKRMANK